MNERNYLVSSIRTGMNHGIPGLPNWVLFEERNNRPCDRAPDRYGLCVDMVDHAGEKVFETRYSDFPW